jgi:hypothetical protein
MDVYVITGEIEYEGSTVLGVAGTLAQAQTRAHEYAAQHDTSLHLNGQYARERCWVYDLRRGGDWDITYVTLSIQIVTLDAELKVY